MRTILVLFLVLLTGCHAAIVEHLERRHIQSCIWWRSPTGVRTVTATGGMDLERCLAVPCMTYP